MTHDRQTTPNQSETEKRLSLLSKIADFVNESSLTGLLVTGSIAWGKNYAVNSSSDIDFYLIAPNLRSFEKELAGMSFFSKESRKVIKSLLSYVGETNTRSLKTPVGDFHGAIYFFEEERIQELANNLSINRSKYFPNLRPINKPQTKTYVSFTGKEFSFTTPIQKLDKQNLWIRTDPVVLINRGQFYGSIFLSHLLYGDIYVDKTGSLNTCKSLAEKSVKSRLSGDKKIAFKEFINYLPRSERMTDEVINKFFDNIWQVN